MINYTDEQFESAIRKSINPSRLSSYLPVATPYTTPALTLNVPTKLLIPTTPKYVNDFTLDVPNSRWFLDVPNVTNRKFNIAMTTSLTASVNNVDVDIEMWKNGVFEEGVSIRRKIGTGADTGAMAVVGSFELSTNDYVEVYVRSSASGTLTFIRTAINIMEVN